MLQCKQKSTTAAPKEEILSRGSDEGVTGDGTATANSNSNPDAQISNFIFLETPGNVKCPVRAGKIRKDMLRTTYYVPVL